MKSIRGSHQKINNLVATAVRRQATTAAGINEDRNHLLLADMGSCEAHWVITVLAYCKTVAIVSIYFHIHSCFDNIDVNTKPERFDIFCFNNVAANIIKCPEQQLQTSSIQHLQNIFYKRRCTGPICVYSSSWSSPRLVTSSPKHRRKRGGITILRGRLTGAVVSWSETKPLVNRAHASIYQGYLSLEAAQATYDYAEAHGWTGPTSSALCTQRPIPMMPDAIALLSTPNPLHAESGTPARCLECSLNVVGISAAVHDSWATLETSLASLLFLCYHVKSADNSMPPLFFPQAGKERHAARRNACTDGQILSEAERTVLSKPPRSMHGMLELDIVLEAGLNYWLKQKPNGLSTLPSSRRVWVMIFF
ncbi:hypothetical protein C8R43DRAFT_951567 [Mycena crocata]|nr:hypothetical protein C8R43DRAFT_951567 [Mycena crocata]